MQPSPRILTHNFVLRLHAANEACRYLKQRGMHPVACVVAVGDALTLPQITVADVPASLRIERPGVKILRQVGGAL